jgi:hypothetical protein
MFIVKASVSIRLPSGKFPQKARAAALKAAVPLLIRDAGQAFEKAADPITGKPWPPRKRPYPWPMLVRSGRMKAAVLKAAAGASITGHTLTVRLTEPRYLVFHQRGTRHMARRRVVGITRAVARKVRDRLRGEGVRVFRSPRGG